MRKLSIIVWLGAALLTGCGGNSDSITGENSTGVSTTTGTTTVVLSMGSGTASSFQSGVLAISTKSLSAGGSTSLLVSIVDQTGALYTTPTAVTFSSPCQAQGLATIVATPAGVTPTSPTVTTSTGSASATYSATGCSGSDVITASASANSQSLTASGTVTVAQAAIGSISFISATPSTITLKGVGSAGGSATSTVVFQVLDTSGGPRAGATVTMSLNTTVGGITLAPTTATTDANGQVQTVVSGGTVATSVRVTASTVTAGGTTVSTESNSLTVSTGIPTSHNISLAVGSSTICPNVEAWDRDGVTVPVTVSMTDRFSNPVPDGTTANFQTTLGGIQASCQTTGGSCSVTWTSKAPYSVSGNPQSTVASASNTNSNPNYCPGPAIFGGALCNSTTNGRSPIMVSAIGEESFIDATGSGYFNPGDTVPFNANNPQNDFPNGTPKPWDDTSEPFLNEWELGDSYADGTVFVPTYVLGEPFIDFFNTGKREGPDGLVQSALCEGPLCSTAGSSVAIYANNVIVLSGSGAYVTWSGTPHLSAGGSFSIRLTDLHNQQMPGGTTMSITASPSSATTIVSPTAYVAPCSEAVGGQSIPIITSAGSTPSAGTLLLTITTPAGITTAYSIPFT
jgi:hypothetical protein